MTTTVPHDELVIQLLDIVRELVADEYGRELADEIDADSPLLTTGYVTSLQLVELQTRCEERFGTSFDPTELGYDNGDTVRQLADAIRSRT